MQIVRITSINRFLSDLERVMQLGTNLTLAQLTLSKQLFRWLPLYNKTKYDFSR